MGHRLSKIYTRTGDDGTTGLGDGRRVDKDDLRIEAMGAVDELNSALGLVTAELANGHVLLTALQSIQHELLDIGGELSIPGYQLLKEEAITRLESEIDAMNQTLPPLKEFILPGGNRAAAAAHLARTIARRAERRILTLSRQSPVQDSIMRYLNRLSDWLFVAARVLSKAGEYPEIQWQRDR